MSEYPHAKSTNTPEQFNAARKEFRTFLSTHGLDDTSELASVYYTARAQNLIDQDATREEYDAILPDYRMWRELAHLRYQEALRYMKSLIAMEK